MQLWITSFSCLLKPRVFLGFILQPPKASTRKTHERDNNNSLVHLDKNAQTTNGKENKIEMYTRYKSLSTLPHIYEFISPHENQMSNGVFVSYTTQILFSYIEIAFVLLYHFLPHPHTHHQRYSHAFAFSVNVLNRMFSYYSHFFLFYFLFRSFALSVCGCTFRHLHNTSSSDIETYPSVDHHTTWQWLAENRVQNVRYYNNGNRYPYH